MKIVVLDENFHIGDVPAIREKIMNVSEEASGEIIYEVDESIRDKLKVLEELGLIKEIKSERRRIEKFEDVIRLTEEVVLLNGGSVHMRVKLLGKEISFTEAELLSGYSLQKQLLRFKEIVPISYKNWVKILSYWFSIAKEINETSEEEEVVTKVLNYLGDCVIFDDINLCMGLFSLYFDASCSNCVYCSIEDLAEFLKCEKRRKLRSVLSDYIVESKRLVVNGKRKRFWGFDIQKSEIEFEKQLFKKEEMEDG